MPSVQLFLSVVLWCTLIHEIVSVCDSCNCIGTPYYNPTNNMCQRSFTMTECSYMPLGTTRGVVGESPVCYSINGGSFTYNCQWPNNPPTCALSTPCVPCNKICKVGEYYNSSLSGCFQCKAGIIIIVKYF